MYTLSPFSKEEVVNLVAADSPELVQEFREVAFRRLWELKENGILYLAADPESVFVVGATLLSSVFCIFVFFHLLIDKIFYSKHLKPKIVTAVRRGILFTLAVASILVYRFFGSEWYLIVLTVFMILLVEVFVVRLLRKRKEVSTNTNIDSNTSTYNAIEQSDSVSA
jgi:uncharacterized membrane protein (UPF0136 family)